MSDARHMPHPWRFSTSASRQRTTDLTGSWGIAEPIRISLVRDGWATPNTYGREFEPLVDGPAVYLFMLYETDAYKKAVVAYVGMSTRLSRRIASHEILALIDRPGFWAMTWFKPVDRKHLRTVEGEYIRRFDPPWNIAGRVRGVALQ